MYLTFGWLKWKLKEKVALQRKSKRRSQEGNLENQGRSV